MNLLENGAGGLIYDEQTNSRVRNGSLLETVVYATFAIKLDSTLHRISCLKNCQIPVASVRIFSYH